MCLCIHTGGGSVARLQVSQVFAMPPYPTLYLWCPTDDGDHVDDGDAAKWKY